MAGRPGAPGQSKKNRQKMARAGRRQAANVAKATTQQAPKPGIVSKAVNAVASHPKITGGVAAAGYTGAAVMAASHINSNRRSAHQGIDTKSQQHWNMNTDSNKYG